MGEPTSKKFSFKPKFGIDNPALCLGEDPGSNPEPTARIYVLRKDASGNFGFTLRKEEGRGGHIVHNVIPMSPAHLSGLKEGDRLLKINGEYVHEQEHLRCWNQGGDVIFVAGIQHGGQPGIATVDHVGNSAVAQKVKASGSFVSLTVVDDASFRRLSANRVSPLSILHCCLPQSCPRPRLCLLYNEGQGFGFTASATGGVRGTFILTVEEDGPAKKSGVPSEARLLELNGESVMTLTLSQLTKKLQNCGSHMVLLVLEASAWDVYEFHGVTPSIAFADTSFLPYKTRQLRMIRRSEGYGFLLRQEKCKKGQGQFLREIDPGLPAAVSGMREGDRLLGVNGQSVDGLEHEDIVSLIQESGNKVTLLVISNEGDRFYNEIGVSPLLFYEDETFDSIPLEVMKESTTLQSTKSTQTTSGCSGLQQQPVTMDKGTIIVPYLVSESLLLIRSYYGRTKTSCMPTLHRV
ncbi:Na(+)/H(+) exchange regulatory cofactor NHE-RF4 [Gastrophryne carolinensis]